MKEGSVAEVAKPVLRDAGLVLVWFVVAAVLAAVVWWQVTPLPVFTRTRAGAVMDQVQLGRQVAIDGWYFVIAAAVGVVSGVSLTAWRRRDPVLTVLLLTACATLGGWLTARIGRWLGPASPHQALAHLPVGAHAPVQLALTAHGEQLVWPMAALLGAVGVLWGSNAQNR
ncbi:MAG TPA: hypothetical protein VI452_08620 [Marmoricola sp.]